MQESRRFRAGFLHTHTDKFDLYSERTRMSPPEERSLRSGPPPLTEPASRLLPLPPFSMVIVRPVAFTSPPEVLASSWKPAPFTTCTSTWPPDVLRSVSCFS